MCQPPWSSDLQASPYQETFLSHQTRVTAKFTPLSMYSSDVWGWKKCVKHLQVQGSALFFPPASAVGFRKTLTWPGKPAIFSNKFNIVHSSNGPRLAGSTKKESMAKWESNKYTFGDKRALAECWEYLYIKRHSIWLFYLLLSAAIVMVNIIFMAAKTHSCR